MNKNKKIPNHIGIIMDGNRRWAKERNLSSFDGCRKGCEVAKLAPEWFFSQGVKILSLLINVGNTKCVPYILLLKCFFIILIQQVFYNIHACLF